ncbi:AP-1-like transcription factor, partial [Phenoliferia sp. Uapishka_3]
MSTWPSLSLSDSNEKDSYLSTLTSYLASHPPGSLVPSTLSLSSPEGSDSSSPSSSDSTGRTTANQAGAGVTNDKRKTAPATATALKDRRSSNGSHAIEGHHTHPDAFDDDDENSPDGDKGKGGKTSDRRRAQNRQAQRAFRERKEKHLKELEDRVFSLEQQTTDQVTENAALKQLLERLQGENERLKVYESAFSFSYAKDVSNSSSMPTSNQFGGKPPTPPTSHDDIDDVSSFSLPEFGADSNNIFANSQLFPSSSAPFSLPSTLTASSGLDQSLFLNSLTAPSPSSTAGDSTSGSSANVGTPPDLSSDIFSSYRDMSGLGNGGGSGAAFSDFDSIFGGDLGDPEPNYSAFIASPSPSASLPSKAAPPAAACGVEKFTFDVDGLCSE